MGAGRMGDEGCVSPSTRVSSPEALPTIEGTTQFSALCRRAREDANTHARMGRAAAPRARATPLSPRGASRLAVTTRAAKDSGGDSGGGMGKFLGGFLLGGAIFGVAGVLFAPQLSKTFLKGKDAAGRFLYDDYESDEDADAALERTRNDLNEKIAQLNAAIDTFAGEADKGLRDGDDDGDDDEGVENENENDEKAEATAGKISGE